jgi:hypothetical protein
MRTGNLVMELIRCVVACVACVASASRSDRELKEAASADNEVFPLLTCTVHRAMYLLWDVGVI